MKFAVTGDAGKGMDYLTKVLSVTELILVYVINMKNSYTEGWIRLTNVRDGEEEEELDEAQTGLCKILT